IAHCLLGRRRAILSFDDYFLSRSFFSFPSQNVLPLENLLFFSRLLDIIILSLNGNFLTYFSLFQESFSPLFTRVGFPCLVISSFKAICHLLLATPFHYSKYSSPFFIVYSFVHVSITSSQQSSPSIDPEYTRTQTPLIMKSQTTKDTVLWSAYRDKILDDHTKILLSIVKTTDNSSFQERGPMVNCTNADGTQKLQKISKKLRVSSEDIPHGSNTSIEMKGRSILGTVRVRRFTASPSRFRLVYRVVHGARLKVSSDRTFVAEPGHPGGGLLARGHSTTRVTPFSFQTLLQKHLMWHCRVQSPFLSVTSNYDCALKRFGFYLAEGFQDIRILTIDMAYSGWNFDEH
ncbi:hypothetical protein QBC35DRAFT_77228, partial [Podospora australis]